MLDSNEFIKIRNLEKVFPVRDKMVRVIKNVNLSLPAGKFIIFFGPSGSGKSTLLNTILGLEKPTRGEVTVGGLRLDRQNDEELTAFRKENVGVITQQPNWIKSSNVIANVAFPLFLRGIPTHKAYNRAVELLTLLGMRNWADFYPTELSFGQQQKIAVARALTTDPKLIIADEPTGNLDYSSGVSLVKMLANFAKHGKTIIMVTHDLNNLEDADIIVRIFDGKVVEIVNTADYTKEDLKNKLIDYEEFYDKTAQINPTQSFEVLTEENLEKFSASKKRFRISFSRENIRTFLSALKTTFFILVSLVYRLIYSTLSLKFVPGFLKNMRFNLENNYARLLKRSKFVDPNSITPSQLLDIALRSLFFRKTRAMVTIGGVSIGIAFTVFLLSIGFGIEKLVISRVTTLSQLSQLDAYPSSARQVKIDSQMLEEFKRIENVEEVFPVINLAGRVQYQQSNLDAVVFSVQGDFLKRSDFSLVSGKYFDNDELPVLQSLGNTAPQVAGENLESNGVSFGEFNGAVDGVFKVDISEEAEKVAVVNLTLLQTLGVSAQDAIGKTLDISFLLTKDANDNSIEVESEPELYTIVGVIGNADSPLVYVPIKTTESFGQVSYTQTRIVADKQENIGYIRQKIEALGYRTTSVLDTISQIEGVFSTARAVFFLIGIVGLSVAALGMFNTLTVSLLERTKEVGIMKVIGLRGKEVQQLFLSESIMISLFGSFLGIFLGVASGFILSVLVSLISLSRANVFVNISYLPTTTGLAIVLIALAIGFITGFYPALRATKISPLEALRYE